MRFAHFSDTHLGFRQYGIYERELDFYRAFERTVAKIIAERPDFVLHSGDLFDTPKPPPRALWIAQRCFAKLSEHGIPVYAITGNHDLLMRRGAMPPQVLYRDLNVRLLTEEEPFVVHKDVFIGGVPYRSRHYSDALREALGMLSGKAKKYGRSILMMHQGTDRHLPRGFEIGMKDIPKNFSYYAMGHVHARIVQDFGRGKFVYPGSTELWNVSELDDYGRKGKGFTLVDMHGDVPSVQNITVPLEREILRERIDTRRLESSVSKIRTKVSKMTKKPLLYLDIRDDSFERSALHDALSSRLSQHVLSIRTSFTEAGDKGEKGTISRSLDLPQIDEIIREMLKDPNHAALASVIFRHLSEGNDEKAAEEADRFYRGMGR
jgi:exonuclease SbcD